MRRSVFRVLLILFSLVLIYLAFNFQLLLYGIGQLRGQLNVIINSKPIEEVLASPSFPDSLKVKIRLIQEIKEFGIKNLGLKNSRNYTTVFDQKGKPILWIVAATT